MEEATMSNSAGGGIQLAADQVQRVACRAGHGVGEVRDVIRAQPIAAAGSCWPESTARAN